MGGDVFMNKKTLLEEKEELDKCIRKLIKALKDTFFYRMCDKFAMKIEIFSENIKNK